MFLLISLILFLPKSSMALSEETIHNIRCTGDSRAYLQTDHFSGQLVFPRNQNQIIIRKSSQHYLSIQIDSGQMRSYSASAFYGERELHLSEQDHEISQHIQSYPGGLGSLIQRCRPPSEDELRIERFNAPWLKTGEIDEIQTCRDLAKKVNDLRNCPEVGNCTEVYNRYYASGRLKNPPKFSFQQFFETGSGVLRTLATASLVGYTFDAAAFGFAAAGTFVRAGVTRTGLYLAALGSTAVAWLIVPATALWLYLTHESCDSGLDDPNNTTLEACTSKGPQTLSRRFGSEIDQAIENPDQFNASLETSSNRLASRLACSVLEEFSNRQDYLMGSITCYGNQLTVGDRMYELNEDGHLSRKDSPMVTYRFGKQDQEIAAEHRIRNINPNRVQSESLREEARLLALLAPRIEQVKSSCSLGSQEPASGAARRDQHPSNN